jgi:protein FrlC
MQIGIVSGIYLNYPIEEAVRRVSSAGYDTIDIWSGRPHLYRNDFSPADDERLRQFVEDQGLKVSSFLPAFYRYPYSLSNPNEIVRQDSIQYMKECMDHAVQLGAPILLVVPERTLYGQSIEDGWERLVDSISSVCEYARQYDIKLGLEPTNHFISDLVNTAADALRIIEELDFDRLGIVLDTGHINLGNESTREAVRLSGSRLLQVHVNDNDGTHQQNLIPGTGTFDFQTLVEALSEAEFGGALTAELGYHYTHEPDPAVRAAALQMRSIIEGKGQTIRAEI